MAIYEKIIEVPFKLYVKEGFYYIGVPMIMFGQQSLMWTPKIASIKIHCVYSDEKKSGQADGCETSSLREEYQLRVCGA